MEKIKSSKRCVRFTGDQDKKIWMALHNKPMCVGQSDTPYQRAYEKVAVQLGRDTAAVTARFRKIKHNYRLIEGCTVLIDDVATSLIPEKLVHTPVKHTEVKIKPAIVVNSIDAFFELEAELMELIGRMSTMDLRLVAYVKPKLTEAIANI